MGGCKMLISVGILSTHIHKLRGHEIATILQRSLVADDLSVGNHGVFMSNKLNKHAQG